MRILALFALALFGHIDAFAAQSVCADNEKIVWSCKNPDATYAVCASEDLTQTVGYLQYRATNGDEPGLEFPDAHVHPAGLFSFFMLARGAMLVFEQAGVKYTMSEDVAGTVSLSVSEFGRHLYSVECDSSDHTLTLTDTINLLKSAGVVE